MPTRLEWNLGTGDDEPEMPTAERARRSPAGLTGLILVVYLCALIFAGFVGFRLGRASVVGAHPVRDIETQLAIEALAWRRADMDLYVSTLSQSAPDEWRRRQLNRFHDYAPADLSGEIEDRQTVDASNVIVRVRMTMPQGSETQVRMYHLDGDVWGQTAMEGE